MPVVRATPNQFLLVGRGGRLENRGSAVQAFLLPGAVWVLVPSTKQEATFEFTQETQDGIPLRFKGIVVYRIVDPVAAARQFDFAGGRGTDEITDLLVHVCLGELRDAVSHMTMADCIEGRKTTLSEVVESALASKIHGDPEIGGGWGITIEVAQLAQVFIVDPDVRRQLEAEVRNEIKLQSDRSDLAAKEGLDVARLASESRVAEQRSAVEVDRTRTEAAAEQARLEAETPARLARIERDMEIARRELELRRLQNELKALEVEHELLLPQALQDLRREILPLEQAPQIVKAASRVLSGTNLSVYGDDAQLVGQLAPVFEVLARAVGQAMPKGEEATRS